VVTVNVAWVVPAGTVTLAGTLALVLLLDSAITAPPEGAGPLNVTVPVEGLPPRTDVGLRVSDTRVAGFTVKVTFLVVPLYIAEIVISVLAETPLVVTTKAAVSCPASTVTLAGTWAAGLLLVSVITAPPAGAGMSSVTVPVEGLPPRTAVGETETEVRTAIGAVTVRRAVRVIEL